jgi:hypothetical protein
MRQASLPTWGLVYLILAAVVGHGADGFLGTGFRGGSSKPRRGRAPLTTTSLQVPARTGAEMSASSPITVLDGAESRFKLSDFAIPAQVRGRLITGGLLVACAALL